MADILIDFLDVKCIDSLSPTIRPGQTKHFNNNNPDSSE